jgi:type IV pilus assembly protein PilN
MVRINLLPIRDILRKRELKQLGVVAAAVLIGVVAIMAVAYLVLAGQVDSVEGQKKGLEKRLADLKKENQQINADKAEILRLEKQLETVNRLTNVRETPAPLLAAISKAIPDEVWLQSISQSGKGFTLQGEGIDNTVVVTFVQRLQKVPGEKDKPFFPDVKLVNIVRQRTTGGAGPGAGLGPMAFTIQGRWQ